MKTDEIPASCTETGSYVSTIYCSECSNQISQETVTVPKKGHTAGEKVKENEIKATCKVAAYHEEVVYCSVCGDEISRTLVTGDKLPHEEEIIPATAPTCTEAGLTEGKKCTVCGDTTAAQTVIGATGHKMGEWETVEAPTCTSKGLEKRECSVCDYYEDRETDKTAHSFNEDGVCEGCGTEKNCSHICHRQHNIFAKIVWTIIRYICSIFGIGKTCSCGDAHY